MLSVHSMSAAENTESSNRDRSPKRRRLDRSSEQTGACQSPRSRQHTGSISPDNSPYRMPSTRASDFYENTDIHTTPSSNRARDALIDTANASSPTDDHDPFPFSTPAASGSQDPVAMPDASNETLHYRRARVLHGHCLAVSAVRFSPDGSRLATCSSDATAKVWSVNTAAGIDFALLHTLSGHLAGISALAWAPDSKLLATGSDDKTIRLWNATTGRPYPTALRGHHNAVYALAFSPKGNMLVSGSVDEAVFLWDVRAARLMRSLPAHSDPVTSVDFVRDGTLVASCSSDGLIRIWDTATGQCLRTIFHEDKPLVTGVKFSPNGRFLATWMLDSSVRLWDYVQGRCVKTYKGHRNTKFSLCGAFGTYGGFNGNRNVEHGETQAINKEKNHAFIATGSEDGAIVIWDVVSKAVLQVMHGHKGAVFGIDVHPTIRLLASCGKDKTICIWEEGAHGVQSPRDTPSPLSDKSPSLGKNEMSDTVEADEAIEDT